MAGSGRVPKLPGQRRNRSKPRLGEWRAAPGVGWQHGPIPEPPDGLMPASASAWMTWFGSWWAAQWTPADLPGLRLVIGVYDAVERGQGTAALRMELVGLMDRYGITPKGRQDRRWTPPKPDETPAPTPRPTDPPSGRYAHLRVIPEGDAS